MTKTAGNAARAGAALGYRAALLALTVVSACGGQSTSDGEKMGFPGLCSELTRQLAPHGDALAALASSWNTLPQDLYLRDGGSYRSRRHACFVQECEPPALVRAPHRAHWQPTTYNALHGGLERWFEPIAEEVTASPAWPRLLIGLGEVFATLRPVPRWYIEAHQFRIDTASGIGRPTPEGAHRDGVDYIGIVLVDRVRVLGGETRVFPADSGHGVRFTLAEPWATVSHVGALLTAVQAQLGPVDTATVADPPADVICRWAGVSV